MIVGVYRTAFELFEFPPPNIHFLDHLGIKLQFQTFCFRRYYFLPYIADFSVLNGIYKLRTQGDVRTASRYDPTSNNKRICTSINSILIDVWNTQTFDDALLVELQARQGMLRNYELASKKNYRDQQAAGGWLC